MSFRDLIFNHLYHSDINYIILSLDFGSPALERFIRTKDRRFINVGICEQNAVTVAAGLWDSGVYPIVYSISSFLYSRAFEQIKLLFALQRRRALFVGVGSGYGYAYDGPTHHALDEVSVLGPLPGLSLYKPSNETHLTHTLSQTLEKQEFSYYRLDRGTSDFSLFQIDDISVSSFRYFEVLHSTPVAIISNGLLFNRIALRYNDRYSLINFHTVHFNAKEELEVYFKERYTDIYVVAFEFEYFGMDALIRAACSGMSTKVHSIGVTPSTYKHYKDEDKLIQELLYARIP